MQFAPITPIQSIQSVADLSKTSQTSDSGSGIPFQDLFLDAVQNVKSTDSNLNQELYKLATGQSDDLHNLTIASQKATLSVQLLVQLRNKALDAYNEIMRINV
ncbi:MAG TPA: flagellar hook-basal body complex protein FliE [Caproiciproducens sp.]|nr:flagellar hook-basal body complex protein FliE [Caproiciproducens sp.]